MKLHFVDTEPDLVAAWRFTFANSPEVDVLHDDIVEVARNTLVSPANSFGHMDGGIDRHYISHFGQPLQRRVYDAIDRQPEGHLPVG